MHYILTLDHKDGSVHYATDERNASPDINKALVLASERKVKNLIKSWERRIATSPISTAVPVEGTSEWTTVLIDVPYTCPKKANVVLTIIE